MAALPRLRRTTLAAPALWAALAAVAVTAAEVGLASSGSVSQTNMAIARCLTGGLTCCPLLALLGAKRPQDRAWGWIVLSLWIVLALPALQAWLFQRGFELHPAQAWFLLILIVTGAINHLASRYAPSACLASAGQVLLMKESLPAVFAGPAWPRLGLGLFAAAVLLAWLVPSRSARSLDRVWLDFRDAFGLVWGLRVQERVNSAATAQSWPVRLSWRGFQTSVPTTTLGETDLPIPSAPAIDPGPAGDVLRNSLWRFVSPGWIAEREAGAY
ncbi:MAG: hypothetical protein U0836_06735 [Pirellulales bacterium]